MESFDGKALLYGRGQIALPEDWVGAPVLAPGSASEELSLTDALEKALDKPIASPPLSESIRPGDEVVIVASDVTRPGASAEVVRAILTRLPSDCAVKIFVALGLHRKQTKEELKSLLGRDVAGKYPVFQNESRKASTFIYMGRTRFGTEIELSRHILPKAEEAVDFSPRVGKTARKKRIILTGAITPHYFFGFSGGRKSIVPGCASQQTIYENHFLSFTEEGLQHPACRAGNLNANPCHEDALEATATVSPTFLVNTVVGGEGKIVSVVAGDWRKAHEEGCNELVKNHSVRVGSSAQAQRVDVVVVSCGGYPRDINFIQAHKAIDHSFHVVKPGGTMVVVGECSDGFGHPTFFRWFRYKDLSEFARQLRLKYQVYGQTAYATLWKAKKVDILLVSRLKPEDVREMSITPVSSLAQARARVKAKHGKNYSVTVIPFATDALILGEEER